MRRLLPVLFALLATAAMGASRGDQAAARATVLARFDAALRADTGALERLLADDLDYCNFRGECESKRQYIDELKTGVLRYAAIAPTVEKVKLFADTAAVTGKVTATATRAGVQRTIHAAYLAVLVWRDSRWQLTSWSTTLLELNETK
jgi:hypothetical protein